MTTMASRALLIASGFTGCTANPFVPFCIADKCSNEASALFKDEYTSSVMTCASQNFGQCADKAWECLGDQQCRAVVDCAPTVFETCKADFWKMLTDPDERDKLMCLANCMQDGKINPLCVAGKCGAAAGKCLLDKTCRHAAECAPQAMLKCSATGFKCIFEKSGVCMDNLKCLGNGLSQCGAGAVNLLTDSKISDFVKCAGTQCPHPVGTTSDNQQMALTTLGQRAAGVNDTPTSSAGQLLCMAHHCTSDVMTILGDKEVSNTLTCAIKAGMDQTCSSAWECLGDTNCAQAISCWSKPLDTCTQEVWTVLTDDTQRQRLERGAGCLRSCAQKHADDFVQASFCIFDTCGQDMLDCWKDSTCKAAVQCLPDASDECALVDLDAYLHQDKFKNTVKCLGQGLEVCGRAAVGLLQDQNIVKANQCNAQCTRAPPVWEKPLPAVKAPTPRPAKPLREDFQAEVVLPAVARRAAAADEQPFVPLCIAEQCSTEAKALFNDKYTTTFKECAGENFEPCAGKAWDCLGDAACRSVLTCAPVVLDTCKADLWKMVTEPSERDKLMCLSQCLKEGQLSKECALEKCGKAAVECLEDETCRASAECLPKTLESCDSAAKQCVFGESGVCRDNLQCLGNGVEKCGASAVNWMTDGKIADFINCAGSKCPHPVQEASYSLSLVKSGIPHQAAIASTSTPASVPGQLLCTAEHCLSQIETVLKDQDTTNALNCAHKASMGSLCPAVWECLGDSSCSTALSCWSKPLETCSEDIWHVLTDDTQRKRIEHTTSCLRTCQKQHADDFVQGFFCFLDQCGADLLSCSQDSACRSAATCLPEAAANCTMPSLDAYVHQDLFKNSLKCIGQGLETCGRGMVGLLQDKNIANAVQCSSQCTRTPAYPMPTEAPAPTPAPTAAPAPAPMPPSPTPEARVQCDDDSICTEPGQKCLADGGFLQIARSFCIALLPKSIKDAWAQVPGLQSLVSGTCRAPAAWRGLVV